MGKYFLKFGFAAMAFGILLTLSGCKDDEPINNEETELPEQPAPLPVDDLLKEKVTIPTIIIGSNFDPVTSALINRIISRADEFTEEVKAVIIDAVDIASLTDKQKSGIKDVFDRGGSIILSEADPQTAIDFSLSLGEEPSICVDKEEDNDHFCDVYVFNNHNDEYIVQDVHAKLQGYESTEEDGEIVTIPTEANDFTDLTSYQYGLRADKLAVWINNNSEPHKPSSRTDLDVISSAQTVAFDYYPKHYNHDKAAGLTGSYTVIYMITSLYSFDQRSDYYAIHQEVIGSNEAMHIGNWKEGKNFYYGFYLHDISNEHTLLSLSNTTPEGTRIQTTSPSTTENARQESVSLGFSLGGEVGVGSGGASAGISAGINYSESYIVNIPDVSIANQCKSDDSHVNAKWTYSVAAPSLKTNWIDAIKGFNNAPLVATNTIDYHNTWLWVISNPEGSYRMKCTNTISYGQSKPGQAHFIITASNGGIATDIRNG